MRSGLIAEKVGMTRVFAENGVHVPVTVLRIDNCQVVAQRTEDKDGYTAVQLGAGQAKVKNISKPMRGHFAKSQVEPKRKVVEFRVSPDSMIDVGAELTAEHFVPGQLVDITGTTIGKGFAGVMKRHISAACVLRTASRSRIARTARPVSARIRARCSKARRWPATWVAGDGNNAES